MDQQAKDDLNKVVLEGNLHSASIKYDENFDSEILQRLIKETQARRGKATVGGSPDPKTIEEHLI